MYLVLNTTRKLLIIDDLGIELSKHQMLDLDKIELKIKIEESKQLNQLIKTGIVKVMNSDRNPTSDSTSIAPDESQKPAMDKDEMRKLIKEELAGVKSQPVENNQDAVLGMMKEMMNMMKNGVVTSGEISADEDIEIDDDTLMEIHAKTMKKISEGSKASVNYNKKEVNGNKIQKGVDDLEGLIGG